MRPNRRSCDVLDHVYISHIFDTFEESFFSNYSCPCKMLVDAKNAEHTMNAYKFLLETPLWLENLLLKLYLVGVQNYTNAIIVFIIIVL